MKIGPIMLLVLYKRKRMKNVAFLLWIILWAWPVGIHCHLRILKFISWAEQNSLAHYKMNRLRTCNLLRQESTQSRESRGCSLTDITRFSQQIVSVKCSLEMLSPLIMACVLSWSCYTFIEALAHFWACWHSGILLKKFCFFSRRDKLLIRWCSSIKFHCCWISWLHLRYLEL